MKRIIECSSGMSMPVGAEPTENAEDYGCLSCEYILKNKVHRCNKFVGIEGSDPQTREPIKDKFMCSDAWAPFLMLQIAGTNRGQTAALESFRNEVVNTNRQMVQALSLGAKAIDGSKKLDALRPPNHPQEELGS